LNPTFLVIRKRIPSSGPIPKCAKSLHPKDVLIPKWELPQLQLERMGKVFVSKNQKIKMDPKE
jgi:hypothetical protein